MKRFILPSIAAVLILALAACGSQFIHAGSATNPALFSGPAAVRAETSAATTVQQCGRSSGTISAINYTTNPLVIHGITPGPQAASLSAFHNLGGCLYDSFKKAGPQAQLCALQAISVFGTAAQLSGLADTAITCLAESVQPGPATVPTKAVAAPRGTVTETGSTLLLPLLSAWQAAYGQQSKVTVDTAGTGSSVGIADAAAGAVSIGASDAYLSVSDQAKYPGLENIPLAVAALNVNYKLPGVTHVHLNGTVLAEIYSGKITMWNDKAIAALNPGVKLPAVRIVPLHRIDGSGSTFLFTSYLNAQDANGWPTGNVGTTISWPQVPGSQGEVGSGGMVKGCAAVKGCVAYIGVSYAKPATDDGLGTAALMNKSGHFILATPATMTQALAKFAAATPASGALEMINPTGGYPIINYEYAVVKVAQPSAAQAVAVRNFLNWTVTTGNNPAYLNAVGFVPLPGTVALLSQNLIRAVA